MPFQPFQDEELGLITIKPHASAKNFIFRGTREGIQITCPVYATRVQILDAFKKQRARLPRLIRKNTLPPVLSKDVSLDLTSFRLDVRESGFGNLFQARFSRGVLELICPAHTDYSRVEVQCFFEKNITKVVKSLAERYLPNRLLQLASLLQLHVSSCRVSYGKQRLGRCDSYGEILLSYRLMLLPSHLSDYVMLHELAHLTEMNHGEGFHRLLDRYCDGEHRKLEKELRAYRYPF